MKLVISESKGKSYQIELSEEQKRVLLEKKLGEKISGEFIGAAGYELEVTGGSDESGFPMRNDVYGSRKMKAYLSGGVGFNPEKKGERKKKMVCGNTISSNIAQVNAKVLKSGSGSLEEMFGKKKEEKKE